jgi:hypothetical protein
VSGDPSLALQGALVAALKAGAGVGVGTRVYDVVPSPATFPYIRVGDDQTVGDDVDCAELSEVTTRIHVWSRAVGYPEAKTIAGAVRSLLRSTSLTLTGFTVNECCHEQTQYLEDPDGLSRHAVIEFTFLIQHG